MHRVGIEYSYLPVYNAKPTEIKMKTYSIRVVKDFFLYKSLILGLNCDDFKRFSSVLWFGRNKRFTSLIPLPDDCIINHLALLFYPCNFSIYYLFHLTDSAKFLR